MFRCIYKELLRTCGKTPTAHLHQDPCWKSFSTFQNAQNPEFSLINYLKKSCGLPSEKALSASKILQNKSLQDPDSVLTFLNDNGFSKIQIANLIAKRPLILIGRVESNFTPKIQFLTEKGLSKSEIVDVLSSNPSLLVSTLDKRVMSLLDLIRSVSDKNESMKDMLKHYSCLLRCKFEKKVVANVDLLKKYGVHSHRISELLITYPRSVMTNVDKFRENVKVVVEMGFNPSTNVFIEAVRAMGTMTKSTWDAKIKLYKSFGWSEEEVVTAFRRHPSCLMISKEKITMGTGFFVKELGWGSSVISASPILLLLSLEKRIIPRLMVLQALESKGLVKKDIKNVYKFTMSENMFFGKFINKHLDKFPEILKIYKAGLDGDLRLSNYNKFR